MKINKRIVSVIFIVVASAVLFLLNQYGLIEKYNAFMVIPILIAFYSGRYVEQRFKD